MLTAEQNAFLTKVGPGEPAGELLRRYWYPISVAAGLTDEQPTKCVRLLGEDLVLFRDRCGRVGLLADRCAHRGASLCYGRVEERGISCAYHGWLYDTAGTLLETPPERNDAVIRSVKQRAYSVRRFLGMYWAYLGPQPAPEIPPYDVWSRRDGERRIEMFPRIDCNWLQIMENTADPAHAQILHQELLGGRHRRPVNTTRGYMDDVQGFQYELVPYGIMKTRTYINGESDKHPLVFPNILRFANATQIRVPVDDTHTDHVLVYFRPSEHRRPLDAGEDPPVTRVGPFKDPPEGQHPNVTFTMQTVIAQDYMVWESQGPIADRTGEHLSFSDKGVHMFRDLIRENIQRVQLGLDPIGVIRDPQHPIIDTNVLGEHQNLELTGIGTATRSHPG